MLDAHADADLVEHILAAGLLVHTGETVGELQAVIGHDFADFIGEASLRRRRKSMLLVSVMISIPAPLI